MTDNEFNLVGYLTGGVEKIVKGAMKATLKDPKESAFMARYALASRESSRRRAELEEQGEHIPPFLIASITSSVRAAMQGRTISALMRKRMPSSPQRNGMLFLKKRKTWE